MITPSLRCLAPHACLSLFLAALTLPVAAQQPTAAERAASLKAILAASHAVLRQYQWVETTVIHLKGDEKFRQQEQCYYGADGKVQKVVLNQTAPAPKKRGLRGRIAEHKKEELTDYMKEAVSLVRQYMPPDPARIQMAKDAGRVSLQIMQPGRRFRLTFSDYLKHGDSLSLEVDATNNRPLAASVKTHLDSQRDPVNLAVTFGALNDGTAYASDMELDVPGKKLKVNVRNSGYRKQ